MNSVDFHRNKVNLIQGKTRDEIWKNFRSKDINRWTFRNVDKFATHQVIHPGEKPLVLSTRIPPINLLESLPSMDYLPDTASTLRYLHTDAMVVVHKGSIIYEAYYEGMQPHEPHLLFSVSKLFAGALIFILIKNGFLHSDSATITEYLPEFNTTLFSRISIRNLLDMQTGIDAGHLKDIGYLDRASGFAPPIGQENIRAVIQQLQSLKFKPGQKYDYQTINTDILSLLMTAVTGKSGAELIEQYLFKPMGAEFNAFSICDACGISELGGGLAVSGRDLARFGLMIINDGSLNNSQILPGGYLETILKSIEPNKWKNSWLANLTPQAKAYRYHSYIGSDDFASEAIFGVGNFGNVVFIDSKYETVIVILCSYPTGVDVRRFTILMELVKSISCFIKKELI